MASENSFDVVSKVEGPEVLNAVDQASKEIRTRFDLKDTKSEIKLEGEEAIQLASSDEYKLQAVTEILQQIQQQRAAEDYAAAGDSDREGQGDRQTDQRVEKQGAGDHSGRLRAGQQQGSGYAAGYDCIIEET
jgi:uncharacterized protein YajQ (UPF0234 family)